MVNRSMCSIWHRIQGRLVKKKTDIVEAVCRMAQDRKRQGHLSMVAILERSGYLRRPDEITEAVLEQYLREHPGLVDSWLLHSMDSHGSAWYFKSTIGYPDGEETKQLLNDPDHVWIVGCQPTGQAKEFKDGFRACAVYVKKRAERLRVLSEGGSP